jgi:nucleotide-binding universal stress UspA family protein
MRRVVAGYDGSPAALAAARVALGLAGDAGASVTFVHAVGLIERYEGIDAAALPAELAALVAELGVADVAWRADQGDPTSVLLREAAGADLVVVGSRGHGKRAGLMLGSTSLELAERSSVPVLIVPEPG